MSNGTDETGFNLTDFLNSPEVVGVTKLSPNQRSRWLDGFIKVFLQKADSEEKRDLLFNDVRALQVKLGLRKSSNPKYPWFLDNVKEFVSITKDTNEEVLPGSFSQSKKHLQFKQALFRRIMKRFTVENDVNGHPGPSSFGHDVSRLMSVTGMLPKEIGVRPNSNLKSREAKGLTNRMDKSFMTMVNDFLDLMYGQIKSKRVRLEDKSQSGLPLRSYGRGYKTLAFEHLVDHLDTVLQLTDEKAFSKLLDEYDVLFTILMGSRRQADAGGKKRYITTPEDAARGLAANTLVDNSVHIEGVPEALTREFATERFRIVCGPNAAANAVPNAIGTSARETYGEVYGFTFKHHGASDIHAKFKEFGLTNDYLRNPSRGVHRDELSAVAIDVTQFDGDYPGEVLRAYADFFKDTPIYQFFVHQMLPVYVQLTRGKTSPEEPYLNGDPLEFDAWQNLNSGMPSGWSWVSDTGKIMAVVVYYCLVSAGLLDKHSPMQLHKFLLGKLRYAVLNLGDDNVILGPPHTYDVIVAALDKYAMWLCELEMGSRFIGFIIGIGSDGYFNITHDPASYITNLLTPERGINSSFRKGWAMGYFARKAVYLDTPTSVMFHRILSQVWEEFYGTNLDALVRVEADKQEALAKEGALDDEVLTALINALPTAPDKYMANRILMRYTADPSVLSWEFSRDDVLSAFNVDLYDLEARPDIQFTEKVLDRAGYIKLASDMLDGSTPFDVVNKVRYYEQSEVESHLFIHKRVIDRRFYLDEWRDIYNEQLSLVR